MEKICTKCGINKQNSEFYKSGKKNGSLHSQCKQCKNLAKQINIQQLKLIEKQCITEKKCNTCNNLLDIINFTKNASTKDGYALFCKNCRSKIDFQRKENNKNNPIILLDFEKCCYKCNQTKQSIFFNINRKSSDNRSNICIDCSPINNWNNEKQKISQKKYSENNKEKLRLKWKKQGENINRRIRYSLNHRISEAMLAKNITKRNKTVEYLGCTIELFKLWISFQFNEEMTWDNYGKWHLDHVKPCCSFNLNDEYEQKKCFNWSNIRPLWAFDNILKGGTINNNIIKNHKTKVNEFISAQVKEGELSGIS